MTSTQEESKFPTHAGLFGAYSETVVPSIRVTGTDVFARMATGSDDVPSNDIELVTHNTLGGDLVLEHQTRMATIMRKGELITSSTQGGGGYGDVLERVPEAVAQDLREGIITDWVAQNIFKVAYEPRRTSWTAPRRSGCGRRSERRGRREESPGTNSMPSGTRSGLLMRC